MLLLVMTATTTTLTLGLVLHGVTSQPYQATRSATAGPDVVSSSATNQQGISSPADLAALNELSHAAGVTGHSGPYPVTSAVIRAHGHTAEAEVVGRDQAAASVDQPKVIQGRWVRNGMAVVERAFAEALGVNIGDSITLNGRPFKVIGIAITAAFPPFPAICDVGCNFPVSANNIGLVWLTRADVRRLGTPAAPRSYTLNLRLADPARAGAFVNAHTSSSSTAPILTSWQAISHDDALAVENEQGILLIGSSLLVLLAIASVAVLVGGRMADQMRRVGLLKAVGGTPSLVAAVLLSEFLFLAFIGAVTGLVVGWLVAPVLTNPGAGLLGVPGTPPITVSSVALVVAVALAVAVVASLVPTARAARTSTIRALADSVSPPRRGSWLIAKSASLPVPLLLGVRLAARRPRRVGLSLASVAITVSGIVAVLIAHTRGVRVDSGLNNPLTDARNQVLLFITVMLIILAVINAIFITWATAQDSRQSSALARALGTTPEQVAVAISAAQVLPAVVGAILGIPGGIGMVALGRHGGTETLPAIWWLIALVIVTPLVAAVLTAIPARIGARQPVAEILQAETA
jgi:ABC-type lipoprotein release transport system permease subunit